MGRFYAACLPAVKWNFTPEAYSAVQVVVTKGNKGRVSIKVSEEFFRLLKQDQHARYMQSGHEPTYDEILWQMWECAGTAAQSVVLPNAEGERSAYTVTADQASRIASLLAKAEEVLRSPHPVAGVALAANIESFHLLIGREMMNALTGDTPANRRTLGEILESERRIRDFIEEKRRELEGSGKLVPRKP